MRFLLSRFVPLRNRDVCLLKNRLQKPDGDHWIFCSSFPGEADESLRKLLKVAIIGVPNAGKSTLINQIIGRSIFAVSRKVHTTRCCARAVMNVDKTQIVFLDTPGIVSAQDGIKHKLEQSCLADGENAMIEADVVGVLHDVSNEYTKFKLDPKILRLLYLHPTKHTFLILNKIDAMKTKFDLLDCVRILTKREESEKWERNQILYQSLNEMTIQEIVKNEVAWPHFKDVFMVSGLTGDGVGDIQVYLTKLARPGEWIFSQEIITDQKDVKIIRDAVFSKLLDNLPHVVPYSLKIELEYLDTANDGSKIISLNIFGKKRHLPVLIGTQGHNIRKISRQIEQALRQYYLNDVRISLHPKELTSSADDSNLDTNEKEALIT